MSHLTLPQNCTLIISREPITSAQPFYDSSSGAIIEFQGVVRSKEGEKQIKGIDYECFEEMARVQFSRLFFDALKRWPINTIHLQHRIGLVKTGEPSLYLRISAGHRAEAFAACQWIIDEMKKTVPIWKRPLD